MISPWPRLWSLAPGAGVSDEHQMFRRLVDHGYTIHLLVPRDVAPQATPSGVVVHRFANVLRLPGWLPAPLKRLWMLPVFWTVATRAAVRLAREVRPRVVLGFSYYGALPAVRAARAAGVRSVVKLFGVMHMMRLEWPLGRYLYHNLEGVLAFKVGVDHFLILDDGTRGDEVARRWGVPPERITWLPNGIDLEWADRPVDGTTWRRRLGTSADTVVLLSLSRLVDSKRVDRILAAAAAARPGVAAPLEVWIAGDGPLRARLESQARRIGLPCRFLGTVTRDEVPEVMAAADVFLSSSTLTNMSIPTCEAMVLGLPVIALDVGGTAKVVRDGETGLLVPEDDPAAFAAAIVRLATDASLRQRLGAGARALARTTFMDWDTRVGHEIALLDRLAEDAAPGPVREARA